MQTTPEGVQAVLMNEIRQTFENADVSQIMNGFGEAFRMVGPRWSEISQAIAAKTPTISAEAAGAAAPYIPSFSKAASRGDARFVLYLPTAPGQRAGLNDKGNDTYIQVDKKLMVAAGISGGRLFGFGIRDIQKGDSFNHQRFRIDYYDKTQSNPFHVHYHIMNDRRHESIWRP